MEKKFNVEIGTEAKEIVENRVKAMPAKKKASFDKYFGLVAKEYAKAGYVANSIALYNDVCDVVFDNDADPDYIRFAEACMRQIAC